MRWPVTSYSPIGIDLGNTALKAVQFRMDRSGPVLFRAASIPRVAGDAPCSPEDAERLMSALWRLDFKGSRVVLAMPAPRLLSAVMELPPRSSGAPLGVIARQELARSAKADPAAMEMSWWELPGGARANEGTHVMAVGCLHADAESLLDAFEGAGAHSVAIEPSSLALVRALASRLGDHNTLTGIANIAWSTAELIIVHGDQIVYERVIRELGLGTLAKQIASSLSIDDEAARFLVGRIGCSSDAVVDIEVAQKSTVLALTGAHADACASELSMSLEYAARRFAALPAAPLLCGAGAAVPGFAARVRSSLPSGLQSVSVQDVFPVDASCADLCRSAPLLTAAGLALHPLNREACR